MVLVKVRDMAIGNTYLVNGVSKVLKKKELTGNGGPFGVEPDYYLNFDEDATITKSWDETYEEVPAGGKRKSRLNRKTRRKSRKNRRKSNNRRRH
jgi:hypothetical protein